MNTFNKALSVVLITALVGSSLPIRALAEDAAPQPGVGPADFPKELKLQLDYLKSEPRAEEFKAPWIPASPTGEYQMKMIGSKFAMVFTNEGAPIAVFDLSLNNLGWKEIALGPHRPVIE